MGIRKFIFSQKENSYITSFLCNVHKHGFASTNIENSPSTNIHSSNASVEVNGQHACIPIMREFLYEKFNHSSSHSVGPTTTAYVLKGRQNRTHYELYK